MFAHHPTLPVRSYKIPTFGASTIFNIYMNNQFKKKLCAVMGKSLFLMRLPVDAWPALYFSAAIFNFEKHWFMSVCVTELLTYKKRTMINKINVSSESTRIWTGDTQFMSYINGLTIESARLTDDVRMDDFCRVCHIRINIYKLVLKHRACGFLAEREWWFEVSSEAGAQLCKWKQTFCFAMPYTWVQTGEWRVNMYF